MNPGKHTFSLRSKLILAMGLLVAATTLATILVTRQRVQHAYQKFYASQTSAQIDYFISKQEERLESLAEICEEIAANDKLAQLITKGDGVSAHRFVSEALTTAMREELEFSSAFRTAMDSSADNKLDRLQKMLQNRPEVLVFDNKGQAMLPDRRPNVTPRDSALRRLTQEQLLKMRNAKRPRKLTRQQLGFAALEESSNAAGAPVQIAEMVATPLFRKIAPNKEVIVGAIVITLPFTNVEEQVLSEITRKPGAGGVDSGIWIDGKIYSRTIPDDVKSSVAKLISSQVKDSSTAEGELPIVIDGEPHRIVYRELNPDSPFSKACQVGIYSLAEALREEEELARNIAATGAFGLAAALALILLLSRRLTNPINRLVAATGEVRKGNYEIRVPVETNDEVGALSRSFNEMTHGLAMNRKYQSVLSQVTDKDVAAALMQGEVSLGGEERNVSVLFCDIRGFTALTEGMPPQQIISLLNEHMSAMTEVVHAHRGTVDKFVGDMIMAVFGAPKSYGDDAARAARCALEMVARRAVLNEGNHLPVTLGIGLSTGMAVAGCMGSENRLNYTVLGEKVNLASRLCGTADAMQVLIDEATLQHLPPGSDATPLGELELKGFSITVPAWHLKSVADQPAKP